MMNAFKFFISFGVILFTLWACEQEESLQGPVSLPADFAKDASVTNSTPSRNYEVLDIAPISLEKDGYQRLRQNKMTGSVLYANIQKGQIAGYFIRKRDGQKINFFSPGQRGHCPDLYICIDPQTGKYIFYDKCVTDNPCGRPACTELVWCIDPKTGNYILYDKCKTESDPCRQSAPPLMIVNKIQKNQLFCPFTNYTWMIDPETGKYILLNECNSNQQLFLEAGW
ncbi:hypothetical protein [Catalinimonas niigatensis]|uniref:hypothetical protein n=1 Tax=Catalinimonas niigatensis TaxID=1397264 RepID=UPI0026665491|nr:hypothetical protein [Catalinimonas niigatensis]WPP50755.1 hypothetical protein PZB72_29255 [Catalinimonas niigatensis]